MATWLDTLQRASFRDVPFHVDGIEHQAGDNVVLREYPFQDLPTVFRMGDGGEEIKFSAYVIGDDYMVQRDRLRQVLTGAGELRHPTAGTMRVYVNGKYTIKENPTDQGGMARFDLAFVRAEVRRYPAGVVNTQQTAANKAEVAKAASVDAFAASFGLANKPGWAAAGAVARLKDLVGAAWTTISAVTSGLGGFTNEMIANYQALRDGLNDLVRTPRLLAQALADLFALPSDLSAAAARDFAASFETLFDATKRVSQKDFEVSVMPAVGAGLVMYGTANVASSSSSRSSSTDTGTDTGTGTGTGTGSSVSSLGMDTPARKQLALLNAASDQLVEALAFAAWVQAVAACDMTSYDDSVSLRVKANDQATRLLVRSSAQVASDALPASSWHDAMTACLSATLADVRDRSRGLSRLTTYTPDGWMPVWLVSYRLFGTAAYADEILEMNPHITHPLLVPPGKALRVMRHD